MKNMRIPLIICWGVAVLGVILGSFFDLNISQAIASADNGFALTVSAIGPTLGFAGIAFVGGGFIALAIKGQYHIALKVLFYVVAAACFGVSIYYSSGEYFGVNGFYGAAPEWVGYFIVFLPMAGAEFLGYWLFRDCKNKNMWIVFLVTLAVLGVGLAALIPILKDVMHRPRYRFLAVSDMNLFHNWWEPCKNYKELIEQYNSHKDNFKSFPSGHTTEASILLVVPTFLPLAHEKFKKVQMPMFYCGCGVVVLVAFARILAAAHFLSDVSMGATITITALFIANEVVMRIKALQLKEDAPVEEAK